jgi:MoaA/NifB/PqqE/SkfB family radical SAM enzyme
MNVRLGPAGIHFFDRNTGQNLLVDDVVVPISMWASAPRFVSVALTNACDLHCQFCYAPKRPARLDAKRLASWLLELDFNGSLGVGFGGGEPTLHPDFALVCEYAARQTRLAVTCTTHAHLLDDASLARLRGCINFVRVSMDGVGTTYELIRGRSFGALQQRLRNIRSWVPFGVNYVVNSLTLADLDAAIDVAAEAGASEFLLLPEQPVDGQNGIDGKTAEDLRRWVTNYHGPVRLAVSEVGAEGLPTCDALVSEQGLRAYAHIDASGVLKRSSFDKQGILIGPEGVMQSLVALDGVEGARR